MEGTIVIVTFMCITVVYKNVGGTIFSDLRYLLNLLKSILVKIGSFNKSIP